MKLSPESQKNKQKIHTANFVLIYEQRVTQNTHWKKKKTPTFAFQWYGYCLHTAGSRIYSICSRAKSTERSQLCQ